MNEELRNASDIAKDPTTISIATYVVALALSVWGGIVRILREVQLADKTVPQIIGIFVAEIVTSGFVGIITFYLCTSWGFAPLYTAAMTAIAGYMGGRSLALFEALYKARKGP